MNLPIFDQIKRTFTRASGVLLIYIVLSLVFAVLANFFVGALSIGNATIVNIVLYIASAAVTILTFLIARSLLSVSFTKKDFQLNFTWKTFASCCVCMLGVNYFGSLLENVISNWLHLLFGYQISMADISYDTSLLGIIGMVFYVVIVGPIFEELLFRGVILHALDRYHRVVAILVSSLLFAILHLNLEQGFVAFFLGCFLAYISLRTNSLLLPILLHMTNNLVGTLSGYVSVGFLWVLILFGCMFYMLYMVYKNHRDISYLITTEHCDYRYGRLFFTRWTTIVFIICFLIFAL